MEDKVTVEELLYRLKNEGESYALKHYFGRNVKCEDEEAEKLWKKAYDSIDKLYDYLNKKVEERKFE